MKYGLNWNTQFKHTCDDRQAAYWKCFQVSVRVLLVRLFCQKVNIIQNVGYLGDKNTASSGLLDG